MDSERVVVLCDVLVYMSWWLCVSELGWVVCSMLGLGYLLFVVMLCLICCLNVLMMFGVLV